MRTPGRRTTRSNRNEPIKRRDHRLTAHQRGYDRQWRKAAAAYLADNPLCVACMDEGKTVPSYCVDHIVPHRGDQGLFWDESNWQALCERCHNTKTAAGR